MRVSVYLYYNDGVWNGERILPEGWVKQASIAPAANKNKNYGYQFWLNGIHTDSFKTYISRCSC